MWGYAIEYNGATEREAHMLVVRRPNVPAPVRRFETVTIPGADGQIYIPDDTIEDIEIPIEFNFMGEPHEWFEHWRAARRWLNSTGSGRLRMGDDLDHFYRVKNVQIDQAERPCYEIGTFTAYFSCDGWHYLLDGTEEYSADEAEYNPYNTCRPIYIVSGEGTGELTVNKNKMTVNASGSVYIDTDKRIAYRQNGEVRSASVSGDYDDLILNPGINEISVSGGLTLKVIPNWRCE